MGVLSIQDVTPPPRSHRIHHIAVILITFIIVVTATVLYLMFLSNKDEGVFMYNDESLRMIYQIMVNPAGAVTGLGVVVYLWQILWTLYSITTIPRTTQAGYLYYSPRYMCMFISIVFSLAVILHIIWVFLWDAQKLVPEVSVLAASTVVMSVAFFMALKSMMCKGRELITQGLLADVVLVRLFMHNGIAMFFSWNWLNTFVHIGIVVSTETGMSAKDAATLSLALMGFWILLEGILLIYVFDRYTRYVFGNNLVHIWVLLEIVIRGWNNDQEERNKILAVIILIMAIVLLLIKIGYVIRQSRIQPEPLLGCPDTSASYSHGYVQDQKIDGVINLPPLREEKPPVEVLNIIQTDPRRTYVYREPTQSVPVREVFQSSASCYEPLGRPSTPYVDHRAPTIEVLNAPIHNTYRSYGGRSRAYSTLRGTPMGIVNVPGGCAPPQPTCTISPPMPTFVQTPVMASACQHSFVSPTVCTHMRPVHTCFQPTMMQMPHCGCANTSFYM